MGAKAPRVTVPEDTDRGYMDISNITSEARISFLAFYLSRQSQRHLRFKEEMEHGLNLLICLSDTEFTDMLTLPQKCLRTVHFSRKGNPNF